METGGPTLSTLCERSTKTREGIHHLLGDWDWRCVCVLPSMIFFRRRHQIIDLRFVVEAYIGICYVT